MIPAPKAVLFLAPSDDVLVREFAAEGADYGLTPCCAVLVGLRSECEWTVAWVCDEDGQVQAWLEYIHGGLEHSFFLGANAAEAMRRAVKIISSWESPTGKPN